MSGKSQYALFPRSDSQLPPMRYKLTQSPGERAKLVLVNEAANLEPRPLYKEVTRGRGIVRGHRQERSDVLPLSSSGNVPLSQVSHEKQRSLSSNSGRQRSMVAQEIYNRPRDARSAETLQPLLLQPTSYETPRKPSTGSEKLGERIMARKNSRDESLTTATRKSSRDESSAPSRKPSRDETSMASRNNPVQDCSETTKPTPRLQLTTVPEARDESIMERGRPVSRRDSKRATSVDPFSAGTLSPRSHSAAPNYTLPKTCYAPSNPQPSPSKPPTSTRPLLASSVSMSSVPRLAPQPSLSATITARSTPHHPSPRPAPTWTPDHQPRKDSLDPIIPSRRSEPSLRALLALREIDKSCLALYDTIESLHQERSILHAEMTAVINDAHFSASSSQHLGILRQQQQDLRGLDDRIADVVTAIVDRQRRKVDLVDGLPEIQELERVEDKMAMREVGVVGARDVSPWAPRQSSLARTVTTSTLPDNVSLSSPSSPPPLKVQRQRGTVTYAAIMDFLDEFD